MKAKIILPIFFSIVTFFCVQAQVKVAPIFTDNMVLQQKVDAPIWGKAKADQKVTIVSSWDKKTQEAVADKTGKWEAMLTTPQAGGPYVITISTSKKDKIELKNILIGEVWICSGQSNMEWRVRNDINNMEQEIASANYPGIRMITVEKQTSTKPIDTFKVERGGWEVCSPQTVAEFSAVAYFFGREIHKSQNVPVGLINTSWGGTLAEAWTDAESLEEMPYFRDFVESIKNLPEDPAGRKKMYQQDVAKWMNGLNGKDPGFENGKTIWAEKDFADDSWYDFPVPGLIQEIGMTQQNGIFWFRKEIEIPASWIGEELTLKLGTIDDDDFTYFNGVQIGQTEGWLSNREYKVPANLVKPGKNMLAIRVMDTGGSGGFGGSAENIILESKKGKINLSGTWKAKFALSLGEVGLMPRRVDGNPNEPTVLFNAMIRPLVPYAIKGAIWYQGEANTGRAYQYRELLPSMINGWRKQFGHDFSFYIVQLANFMKLQTEPTESTWAELREAQSLTSLHLNETGLAVTIDIGEADDIHPRNKQDVGLRLALSARANTYNENISFSGPLYKSYKIENNKIRISFDHTTGGLKTRNNEKLTGFVIAGADHKFYWANAVIEGNEIVVSSPDVAFPLAVRYAWADNPICNLYNGAGLPASPFRTDDWDGLTR